VVLIVQTMGGTVTVVVVDAVTGQPVAGAQVVVTTSDNVDHTAITDATGTATFTDLRPAGTGSITVTANGYLPGFLDPLVVPATGSRSVTVPLTPDVAVQFPTAFVAQLDWGATPRDLDLHCSGPDGAARFHCFYSNRNPVGYVTLDRDDVDTTGPERITISQVNGVFVPGDYHVWVHCFSTPPPGFDGSGASLTLVSLDGLSLPTQVGHWEVLSVPGPADRIWSVLRFTIDAQGVLTSTVVMAFQPGQATDVL
jgi:hypothetical protein